MNSKLVNLPILLVEDDPSVLETLTMLLKRFQLDIATAASFKEARQFIDAQPIAGLITDVALGDGDGLALAAYVMERQPEVSVAIMSGGLADAPEALKDRVTFLAKPFSIEELRLFVQRFPRKSQSA